MAHHHEDPSSPLILVVEDSLTQAAALRHTLTEHGYQCIVARNGKEALEQIAVEPPTLIVSDIVMPEMNGYDFCQTVKSDAAWRAIPIILLTSLTDSSDIIRGLECKADIFVTKPYEQDYLLGQIKVLLQTGAQPPPEKLPKPIEVEFNGQPVTITTNRRQILNLLLSTYEQCVHINNKLKRHEVELEAANARLAELYRTEQEAREAAEEANHTKDAFLAMVTHELRSPLNAILGWAQAVRTKEIDEETRQRAMETIEQSARTQSHLIEDLLDTARITSGKMRVDLRPVDLVEVVNTALDVVRPAADAKGIELISDSDTHANIITGDPDRLQQVLWNLLTNAIKFTPEGGQISIRLERTDPFARITVTDTGRGIAPEFLPYVFERFTQQPGSGASRRRGGLGLGLSLAKHLVELHGGTIEAASEGEGRGARFTVNLRLRAVRPKNKAASSSLLEGVRVLLVDDEDDARLLVTVLLRQQGADVVPVASAAEALAALQSGANFDVLVSDVGMPGVSGYDLIRQIRNLDAAFSPYIPSVALTAFGRSTDRIRALAAGFQMHVPKPVEPEELVLVLTTLIGRATQNARI